MADERAERRLSAILAADVVGYSRLVESDEAATLAAFKGHLDDLIAPTIADNRGRIVKTMGDGVLAEFQSAVDAVLCARAIQAGMAARNAEIAEDRRLRFRIGINVGDVVIDGDDIQGDGVNVAARMEALAKPGGICISGTVHDHVHGKVDAEFQDLGEQEVKNLARAVRAYRVAGDGGDATIARKPRWRIPAIAAAIAVVVGTAGGVAWWQPWAPDVEPASIEKMAHPLPDKPSIAVLPFDNLSGDPKQDYLGHGMSENIITALSKIPNMFVIARNSTFSYKDKAVKVRQVAEELGVRYVLEGSVQRSGDHVRITAQLIDALGGHHLWAERYDREFKDIFALQDDVTRNVVTALQVELTEGGEALLWSRQTDDPRAIESYLRGREHLFRMNKAENAEAQRLFTEAVALAPKLGIAWASLATTHFFAARFGWSEDRARSAAHATRLAKKALEIDGSEVDAYVQLSNLAMLQRNHEQAEAYCEKALALNPTANATSNCARIWTYLGRPREALPLINQAMRLSPYYPATYLFALGNAHRMLGNYDEAIAALKAWQDRAPNSPFPYDMLAMTYAQAGRDDEARAAAAALLKVKPDFTLKWFAKLLLFKDPAENKRFLDVLRKLGVPESPPLKLPDKPSIAVLAFTNMSDDKQQEYFSDGITEDIITDLSKVSGLFVVARNSTFTYKGKAVDVREVSRDLGVRHVLEGSVRRSGDQLRITVQLVDATTGGHVWAERYDRDAKDVFAIQDEIAAKVVAELAVTLKANEQERLYRRHTDNLEAYETYLRALRLRFPTRNVDRRAKRKRLLERVTELDPHFAGGYALLAMHYTQQVRHDQSATPDADIERALVLAKRAVATDDTFAISYVALANAYLMRHEQDKAVAAAQEAVRIQPGNTVTYAFLGYYLHWAGRADEAISAVKTAVRLNRNAKGNARIRNTAYLGMAYVTARRYEDAITTLDRHRASHTRRGTNALSFLAAAYIATGQDAKAHAAMKAFLDKKPGRTIATYRHPRLYKRKVDLDRYLNLLRRAGMPE